jgi:hypothetical protein
VQLCRAFQGADIDSDHSLVIANIRLKLKKKHEPCVMRRRNVARLNEESIRTIYRQALERNLQELEEEHACNLESRTVKLTAAINNAVEEAVPEEERIRKKWITQETLRLVQEKRELKLRRDTSDVAERKYKDSCNMVRKAARNDKAQWLEQQCKEIENYSGEGKSREVYKMIRNINRKWQPRLTAIKDENDKVLTSKEDIALELITSLAK